MVGDHIGRTERLGTGRHRCAQIAARSGGRTRPRGALPSASWCSVRRPARSPTPPAPTSSRTRDGRVIYVGKAQLAAPAAVELLPEPGHLPPRTAQMVATRRDRRVDPGPQRGRGAHARVQPHQAAPAPVQRPAARRQELPVPGRHRRRRVAPADGDAGPQAQGRPLLRPVRPRLRHPRDARPAAAHVPAAHVQRQQVRPPRAARPALPAVPHREVLRARASARSTTSAYDRLVDELLEFLDGDTDPIVAPARGARCAAAVRARSSSGPPGCATG